MVNRDQGKENPCATNGSREKAPGVKEGTQSKSKVLSKSKKSVQKVLKGRDRDTRCEEGDQFSQHTRVLIFIYELRGGGCLESREGRKSSRRLTAATATQYLDLTSIPSSQYLDWTSVPVVSTWIVHQYQ